MMVCMPRVAMKGGTFRVEMTVPFTAPKQPMISMVMIIATNTGISGRPGIILAA